MTRFINPWRYPRIKHSAIIGLGIIPVIAILGVSGRYFVMNTQSHCDSAGVTSSDSSTTSASLGDSFQLTQFRRRYLDPTPEVPKNNTCSVENPFDQSVRSALKASNLAQTASTQQQWDEVARYWVQAVAWMQAVPPNSPQRLYAEKKVTEYMRNLAYSQQQAAAGSTALNFPSFDSEPLDQQLRLYLSYLSTMGTPDVLIVGSSRALQGIDPQQLRQSLAAKGYQNLTVFNFGINGATAQVVEYLLTEVLTPAQLPRIIVWADGVRAFNSGRIDRTYESILASAGHQRLIAGIRPQLSPTESNGSVSYCYDLPQSCQKSQYQPQQTASPVSFTQTSIPRFQTLNLLYNPATRPSGMLVSLNNIDANGFLPLSNRYDPYTYYQRRPYVPGQYDGDYRAFNLGGEQARALSSVVAFTETHNIPLVFVNLPLTDDYLDGFRWSAEQQFRDNMEYLSYQYGFIFIDLAEKSILRNEYFVDPSHLNRYGARSVAQLLAADPAVPWP
ncbi:MAG: hypothetical protein WBA77_15925 [Microcoleaceae cyanobacterium]